ncbi:MAG: SRPBCC family protein [Gammaproteobacteria bacterium]|nr:SRPBCC family protein [Gammaproteobacteria bacterium]
MLPVTAQALTLVKSDIEYAQNHYLVEFEVVIDAPFEAVRARMTDYAHLDQLSPLVTQSRVLETFADNRQRLELIMRACVLFFCKTVKRVTDVTLENNGNIVTHALPELSDFFQADERWRITPEQARTRIQYRAELVPRFFVPPLIGPAILKYKLHSELETLAERLEHTLGQ